MRHNYSLSGHLMIGDSLTSITVNQADKVLETVGKEIPNLKVRPDLVEEHLISVLSIP